MFEIEGVWVCAYVCLRVCEYACMCTLPGQDIEADILEINTSISLCLTLYKESDSPQLRKEKKGSEREKRNKGVLMTIDLWVWAGSHPLIRLRQRPMGGLSLPLLLPHSFFSCRGHQSSVIIPLSFTLLRCP